VKKFMCTNQQKASPVSMNIPLISNQEVWLNIALIKQYHENMSTARAQDTVLKLLQRLNLERIAYERNPALSDEERFCVMLLRAAMVGNASIIIDRPFRIMPQLKDVNYIFQVLEKIADLYYSCHIYDYEWMSQKYGALCR
jgi:ABC-type lipopolysaccharide export system ATPase subunit